MATQTTPENVTPAPVGSGDLLAFWKTSITMQNYDGLRNYRIGDNPEYDRMAAEACRAESKDAQEARLLREAPGMMNTHQPLFNDIEKPAQRPSLWRRFVALFR